MRFNIKLILAFSLIVISLWSSVFAKKKRANIVFILADDLRADAVGYAGNKIVKTPYLDHLAQNGIVFQNAFVTTPICAVSRASILTGQYAIRNGVHDFKTPVNLKHTYSSVLRNSDYYTGFMGKWGVNAGDDEYMKSVANSFDYWAGSYHQANFFHEETCRWVLEDGTQANGAQMCDCPADKREKKGEDVRIGFNNMKKPIHLETVIIPKKVDAFLKGRDKAKPFCLSISYKSPHGPWQDWDRRYQNLHHGENIPLKKTATLEAAMKKPTFIQNSLESDRARRWLKNGIQRMYQDYYRLIAGLDNSINQVHKLLKHYGVDENTVVIFMGDNGHFMGEHGLGGKWLLYEESIRVPCFIYDPRLPKSKRGEVSEEIVLNVDIFKTIAEIAGVKVCSEIQGKSMMQLVHHPNNSFRNGSFFEHHFSQKPPHVIVQSEGFRSKEWKYIRYTEENPIVEELYHLSEDRLEEHNLASHPEYKSIHNQYREYWMNSRASAKSN